MALSSPLWGCWQPRPISGGTEICAGQSLALPEAPQESKGGTEVQGGEALSLFKLEIAAHTSPPPPPTHISPHHVPSL